ncbi:prepilin-type N-terminal cleavage/methylation domain-containing protein [Oceanobacillus saliphilus]|uniref:prepilin-type N-terminal cleavage/methylation domain-containing protein n=1 Tax=Oceanobacillus saliphilus TaxID=2925834 RepID=UPI00201DC9AE|nr:prepilin-type N-terminal cleavage/methylation domain-containing protein [Oceanobacillus saliphilus]
MPKDSGFTLIEVLIAASITFTTVTLLLPIILLLDAEQKVLSDRRSFAYLLHDELQHFIWEPTTDPPMQFTKIVNNMEGQFEFEIENNTIKGCVEWTNVQNRNERLCYYGLPAT